MIAQKLIEHPLFPSLVDCIKIETYARDGGHHHPRKRIEFDPGPMRYEQLLQALEIKVKCCRCNRAIHPLRSRKGSSNRMEVSRNIYIAVACDLETDVGCSRGRAAREAYIEITAEVLRLRSPWLGLTDELQARRHPTEASVQVRRVGDLFPFKLSRKDLSQLQSLLEGR